MQSSATIFVNLFFFTKIAIFFLFYTSWGEKYYYLCRKNTKPWHKKVNTHTTRKA